MCKGVIILSAIFLSLAMPRVVMENLITPSIVIVGLIMPSVVILIAVMLSAIMLNVVNAECHNVVLNCVDCRYPKTHYGKRRDAKFASAVSSGR